MEGHEQGNYGSGVLFSFRVRFSVIYLHFFLGQLIDMTGASVTNKGWSSNMIVQYPELTWL